MIRQNPVVSRGGLTAAAGPLTAGWPWTVAVLAMVLLGGANPAYPLTRGICEIIGTLALLAAVRSSASIRPRAGLIDAVVALGFGLVLLQLIPLPPAVWTALPGREFVADVERASQAALPWRPISLIPERTMRAALTLLPALSVYVAIRTGPPRRTIAIVLAIAIGAAIGIVHAALQKATGQALWTYPYLRADTRYVIGFFTNHNHLASYLLSAFPLALAGYVMLQQERGARMPSLTQPMALLPISAAALMCATAVALTSSRAGLAMVPISLIATGIAMTARGGNRWQWPLIIGAAIALIAAVIVWLALDGRITIGAFQRVGALEDDDRSEYWQHSLSLIAQFFPLGSGFGSFAEVYARAEPLSSVVNRYINHAHNDWLELIVEGGLGAILLLAGFLVWLGRTALFGFAKDTADGDSEKLVTRLALVGVTVIMLHSAVDYPLRTAAISIVMAAGLAMAANCRLAASQKTQRNASSSLLQ